MKRPTLKQPQGDLQEEKTQYKEKENTKCTIVQKEIEVTCIIL